MWITQIESSPSETKQAISICDWADDNCIRRYNTKDVFIGVNVVIEMRTSCDDTNQSILIDGAKK